MFCKLIVLPNCSGVESCLRILISSLGIRIPQTNRMTRSPLTVSFLAYLTRSVSISQVTTERGTKSSFSTACVRQRQRVWFGGAVGAQMHCARSGRCAIRGRFGVTSAAFSETLNGNRLNGSRVILVWLLRAIRWLVYTHRRESVPMFTSIRKTPYVSGCLVLIGRGVSRIIVGARWCQYLRNTPAMILFIAANPICLQNVLIQSKSAI